MDLERLTQRERELAVGAVEAVCIGPFMDDAELQTVTGFSRSEFEQVLQDLTESDKWDERANRAIGQCLNNLTGYPHRKELEVEQYMACSMRELEELTSKWFGRAGYFERLR